MEMNKVKRVLEKAWDPKEFRSDYGLRSLSLNFIKKILTSF